MTVEERSELPKYPWMESRIPARDALSTFVPDGSESDPAVQEMQHRAGGSRWFPVPGGHRVVMLFDGGPYDATRFTVEAKAWDHAHCDSCNEHIPAMTLCHVTEPGQPYILLCASCYEQYVGSALRH